MFGYLSWFGIDEGLLSRVVSHSRVLHRWSIATSTWLLRRLSLVPGLDAAVAPMEHPANTSNSVLEKTTTGEKKHQGEMQDPGKGEMQHGCTHYRRRCKLVAPCCDAVVWCRHCHNHVTNENEQDPQKRHLLDRKAVTEVVCALCNTRQPVAHNCNSCGVAFGAYSCLKCNFFDDDLTRQQFHCEDCGICRVGGRENYFHCSTCNCCYNKAIMDHVCVENSMHQNCAVCFEYLFDSVKAISVMPCGHTIHRDCLQQLYDHRTYTCPICCRTTVDLRSTWQDLDETITTTPMPAEYRDVRVSILCNDCGDRSLVTFHILGHRCNSCSSYNTRRV